MDVPGRCCALAGYVYATASTLAHANLDIQISPSGWTVSRIPSTALVYGNCSASPAVVAQLYVGVDQAQLGMGLAAALLAGFPLIGWSVSRSLSTCALHPCCFHFWLAVIEQAACSAEDADQVRHDFSAVYQHETK